MISSNDGVRKKRNEEQYSLCSSKWIKNKVERENRKYEKKQIVMESESGVAKSKTQKSKFFLRNQGNTLIG